MLTFEVEVGGTGASSGDLEGSRLTKEVCVVEIDISAGVVGK